MTHDDSVTDDFPELRGGVIAYLLAGYPVLSETFVRDEITTVRRAGLEVDVTSFTPADRARIPVGWSGPYRTASDIGRARAASDAAWWVTRRPRAVLRALAAFRACRFANRHELARMVPSIARCLASRDIRAVHVHFGFRAMMPGIYVAALLGVPATVTLHAADIYIPTRAFARRVSQADRLITVCAHNVDRLVALGVDRSRAVVVPCGVDVDVDVTTATDPHRVVTVGRLVPKKGMDVLIRAFRDVVRSVPQARLEIVGEGSQAAALRSTVAELGLEDHVTFVGALGHEETLARIGDAAVFALACRVLDNGDSDAMPVAIREAMARARPVVATAVAGIPENVDDEVGWVVPSEDPEALAAALVEALTDPATAAAKGAAGRRRQVEHYTLEHSAALMQQVWSDAIAAKAAASSRRTRSSRRRRTLKQA